MSIPAQLLYTKEHEWIRVEGSTGVIGITDFAQDQLGDVVFVELPTAGAALVQGQAFGTVESVKTVSDLYAPVSGDVAEVNAALADQPELVNSDPYGEGWMVKVTIADGGQLQNLMSAAEYQAFLKEAGH